MPKLKRQQQEESSSSSDGDDSDAERKHRQHKKRRKQEPAARDDGKNKLKRDPLKERRVAGPLRRLKGGPITSAGTGGRSSKSCSLMHRSGLHVAPLRLWWWLRQARLAQRHVNEGRQRRWAEAGEAAAAARAGRSRSLLSPCRREEQEAAGGARRAQARRGDPHHVPALLPPRGRARLRALDQPARHASGACVHGDGGSSTRAVGAQVLAFKRRPRRATCAVPRHAGRVQAVRRQGQGQGRDDRAGLGESLSPTALAVKGRPARHTHAVKPAHKERRAPCRATFQSATRARGPPMP